VLKSKNFHLLNQTKPQKYKNATVFNIDNNQKCFLGAKSAY